VAHYCPTCSVTTVQYSAQVCAKCRNAGKLPLGNAVLQLVVPGQAVDPKAVINEQLFLLYTQQQQLRTLQATEGAFRADLAKEMRELNHAINDTIKEWRQLEKSGAEHLDQMSEQERERIVIAWVKAMPRAKKDELILDMGAE
jgi:hypothetical protein